MIFRWFFLGTVLLILTLNSSPASGQVSPSISISPAKFDLPIEPGQLSQVEIKITNNSTVALPLKAVPMDFRPKNDTGDIEFDQPIPDHSAKSWLHATPDTILLAPNETEIVKVSISSPETVADGSYFAVMMFQSELPSNYFDNQDQARIVPWIGALMLLQVGQLPSLDDSSLSITKFRISAFNPFGKIPVQLEVKNNTDFHLKPETEFQLQSLRGPIVARLTTPETTILPGSSRLLEATLIKSSVFAPYRGLAEVKIGGYHQSIKSSTILVLTWPKLILVILLVAVLIYDHYYHGRLKRAVKIALGLPTFRRRQRP